MIRKLFQLAATIAGACAVATATAQTATAYPSRPIQMIVPYTPGTTADTLARIVGPRLAERWKVALVTDNRAGATGIIGTEFVARAAPDGHTLLVTATAHGTVAALHGKLPFDPVKSFAPISLLATSALAILVYPQLGANTLREFLDLARKQPGKLLYSSPGNGGPQHLAMELFKLETGINIVHVPYKGSSGAMTDLMGGHVQATIASLQSSASHVNSGKLRMLAVMSAERSPAFANVPTLKELGLSNLVVDTWYGVLAPAGTSAEIVGKINGELNALLRLPEIGEALARLGLTPAGGRPDRLSDLLKLELARWSRVVTAAGIKAD